MEFIKRLGGQIRCKALLSLLMIGHNECDEIRNVGFCLSYGTKIQIQSVKYVVVSKHNVLMDSITLGFTLYPATM